MCTVNESTKYIAAGSCEPRHEAVSRSYVLQLPITNTDVCEHSSTADGISFITVVASCCKYYHQVRPLTASFSKPFTLEDHELDPVVVLKLQSLGGTPHWVGKQPPAWNKTRAPQDSYCRLCFREHKLSTPHAGYSHVRARKPALLPCPGTAM